MKFARLKLENWQQFGLVDLEFSPHVTVLTGANGSGKTTILRVLASHFGWGSRLLSKPVRSQDGFRFVFRDEPESERTRGHVQEGIVGEISYSNGHGSQIRATVERNSPHYAPAILNKASVRGFFIPSHRRAFRYEQITSIRTQSVDWKAHAFREIQCCLQNLTESQGAGNVTNLPIKDVLLHLMFFGYGNAVIPPEPDLLTILGEINAIFAKMLPPALGFRSIAVRNRSDVLFETDTGDFLFDAASGGMASVLEIALQVYFYGSEGKTFTVLIDEPENHLHASMQRTLLPNLSDAFPDVQFIVSTHSPLVISSVRDSIVYALRHGEDKKVWATRLDLDDRSGTAGDVLRDVLGLGATMPVWAENEIERLLEKYVQAGLTKDTAAGFRREMEAAGLGRWVPDALVTFVQGVESK